ncbi:Vegetative incompatibility HET-E-1-like protein [Cladobotryum mycophilum]|uniref:Vegetative incompatibility HET-E-1-like protein n=1 Tax=Cladobotryum mycophilum TaxID=491253 RepID=A0ABR0SYX0_9HYPO
MASLRIDLVIVLVAVTTISYLWFQLSVKSRPNVRPKRNTARESKDVNTIPTDKRSRQPLEVLYHPAPTDDTHGNPGLGDVDIIAVHGLGSNVDWSWTWKEKGCEKSTHWLKDPEMLPLKVPNSRIMAYNYDSTWHMDAPKTTLQLCGEEFIQSVHRFRGDALGRPIIFIGHSLGGNVIMNGLLYANSEEKFRYLWDQVAGLVFLGSPFRGTKWQPFVNSIAHALSSVGSHPGITKELGFDGPTLQDKLHNFCRLPNMMSTPISCFSELYETDYGQRYGVKNTIKGMIVEPASSWIPGCDRYTLQTDHLKMNKYNGPKDRSFLAVSGTIREMYENANDTIHRRKRPSHIITTTAFALSERPEARDCLKDLFITDPHDDKNQLKRKKGNRTEGTCEWIENTEAFTIWLGTGRATQPIPTNILWLHGNPGKGKSTMAIFLVERLIKIFSTRAGKTLTYFFCESSFSNRRTAISILRGLIYQLIQQHTRLLDYIMPKYLERGAGMFTSFDSLWEIFIAMVNDPTTGCKYCIIDALDECDQDSQRMLLQQFEETFKDQSLAPNVRILITSRPYPEIREYLERYANEDLASFPEARKDIERCIEERVADLVQRKHYTPKVKDQVTKILKERAGGTFLWVGLACDELRNVPSKDAIQVLKSIPTELHTFYEKILKAIHDKEGPRADIIRQMLGFVSVAMWPLSVLELAAACKLHEEEEDADTRLQYIQDQISACRLMVIIQDDKVLLLHKSVSDYLTSDGFINIYEWHANLAYRCIDLVVEHFHNDDWPDHGQESFSEYAASCWPEHARMAGSEFKVDKAQPEFFQINSPSRDDWLKYVKDLQPFYTQDSPPTVSLNILHVAAWWGLPVLFDYFLNDENSEAGKPSSSLDLDCCEPCGSSPLELALESGQAVTVSFLLNMGAKVTENAVPSVAKGSQGSVEVMEILLDLRGDEVLITEEMAKRLFSERDLHAFDDNLDLLELLLDRLGDGFPLTEEVLLSVGSYEEMEVLLEKRPKDIKITERILLRIMADDGSEVKLSRPSAIPHQNMALKGEKIKTMILLLDKKEDEIKITEEVLKKVVRDYDGERLLKLFIEKKGTKSKSLKEYWMPL